MQDDSNNPFHQASKKKLGKKKRKASPSHQQGGVFVPLNSSADGSFSDSAESEVASPARTVVVNNNSVHSNNNNSSSSNNMDSDVIFLNGQRLKWADARMVQNVKLFSLSHLIPITQEIPNGAGPVFAACFETKENATMCFQLCPAWAPSGAPQQSEAGMFELLACLHVLSKHISKEASISFCNGLVFLGVHPVAAFAVLRLFRRSGSNSFSASEKTLISTELYCLFQKLVFGTDEGKIFEKSRVCLAYVMQVGATAPQVCSVKEILCVCSRDPSKRLTSAVWLADGSLINKSELLEGEASVDANEVNFFMRCAKKEEKEEDEEDEEEEEEQGTLTLILGAAQDGAKAEMISVIKPTPLLFKKKEEGGLLRLVGPLSLKGASALPVLTKDRSNVTVACTSRGGGCGEVDAALSVKFFDCKSGAEVGVDPHDLAKTLSDMGLDIGAEDERPCEEAIAVCIDVSNSMGDCANPEENVTFVDSVPVVKESAAEVASMIRAHRYFDLLKDKTDAHVFKAWSYLLFKHPDAIPFALQKGIVAALREEEIAGPMKEPPSSTPCCPITGEIYEDPVCTVDGQCYERKAIEEWFRRGNRTSPVTGMALASLQLIPNYALRSVIDLLKRTPISAPAVQDENIDVYIRFVSAPFSAEKVDRQYPFPRWSFNLIRTAQSIPFVMSSTDLVGSLRQTLLQLTNEKDVELWCQGRFIPESLDKLMLEEANIMNGSSFVLCAPVEHAEDQVIFVRVSDDLRIAVNFWESMTLGELKKEIWKKAPSCDFIEIGVTRPFLGDSKPVTYFRLNANFEIKLWKMDPKVVSAVHSKAVTSHMEHFVVPKRSTLAAVLMKAGSKFKFDAQRTSISCNGVAVGLGLRLNQFNGELCLTVVTCPKAFVLFHGEKVEVFPSDTSFTFRWRLFLRSQAEHPATTSLWKGLMSTGDGVSTGTIFKDDDALYDDACKNPEQVVEEFQRSYESNTRAWDHQKSLKKNVMSRLQLAIQIFESFLDKTAASDYPHRVALYSFGSAVQKLQTLTSLLDSFRSSMTVLKPRGDTKMRDAILKAAEDLVAFSGSQPNAKLNAKLRIIVLTDGLDNMSTASVVTVTDFCRENKIVVDGISVGEISQELRRLTFATGGLCFSPKTTLEQMQISELEVFLRLTEREFSVPVTPSMRSIIPFDVTSGPSMPRRKRPEVFALPAKRVPPSASGGKNATVLHLMHEFALVRKAQHPNYEIFLVGDDVFAWRVVMSAPKSGVDGLAEPSPYDDGVFVLNMMFPSDFPSSPPEVRFHTPIMHVNVNSHGKICHDMLSRAWDRSYSVSHVLNSVYALLLVPEVSSPVNSTLAALYHTNIANYKETIRSHVLVHANRPVDLIVSLIMKGSL